MQANKKVVRPFYSTAPHCIAQSWLAVAAAGLLVFAATAPPAAVGQAGAAVAGKITTVIPVSVLERGASKLETKKEMDVLWGDVITTQRGGRVRVRLGDGSVLSVGSDSQLKIEKHDPQAQSTELELIYGRVRANATRIVAPGGEFKVRTKAAVAGVVGTEKYVEASEILTTVIALAAGQVTVTSTDARFPDPVILNPGETTQVQAGRPPSPKRPATAEELGRAFQATEADPIAQLSPSVVLPGATLQTRVTGNRLDTATSFAFDHSGIQVQAGTPEGSNTVPLTITVASNVPPGRYTLTIARPDGEARGTLVVTSDQLQRDAARLEPIRLPPSRSVTGLRGTTFPLDASEAQAGGGSQIVSYQWQVLNTQVTSSDVTFNLDSSRLTPGSYTVQLVVTDDKGQTATQQYTVDVLPGVQPAEILQALATAYESLQPNQFLQYFDELRFSNYAGFAAAIEDSFRNQLESMRVFQRAVNCSVIEEQNQAVCQADFELQFTLKNQPLELLDASGNPCGGAGQPTCPPGATLGKSLQTGAERTTVRYERGPEGGGWKITDYAAVVSCPGGAAATGINVGSCILAAGSGATPSFVIGNVQVLTTDLILGQTVNGSLEIVPVAGFSGAVNLSGTASGVGGISVQFNPAVASPGQPVGFTVVAPANAPMGFSGPTPFTLVLTGTDRASGQTASANVAMTLHPDFTLTVTPTTTASSPAGVQHNTSLGLMVTVTGGMGFGGSVLVDFPNLPAGFSATGGTVTSGSTVTFPLQVTPVALPGPAQVTVRGTSGMSLIKTDTVFLNVTSDFTLVGRSPQQFIVTPGQSLQVDVDVVPVSGFAGTVTVDFQNLPAGWVSTPPSAQIVAGATSSFSLAVPLGSPSGAVPLTIRGTFGTAVRTLLVNAQVQSIPPATGARTILTAPTGARTQTQTQIKPAATPTVTPATDPNAPASQTQTQPAPGAIDTVTGQPVTADQQPAGTPASQDTQKKTGGALQRPSQLGPAPAPQDQPAGVPPPVTGPQTAVPPAQQQPQQKVAGVPDAQPAAESPAAPGVTPAATVAPAVKLPVERGTLQMEVGGCAGFRLASGSGMECDRGGDIEFHSTGGTSLRMEAEGIRSLGMLAVSQDPPPSTQPAGTSAAAQPGVTYLVQMARGQALVRVVQVRSAPNRLRGPGARPRQRAEGEDAAKTEAAAMITVVLEWRMLSGQ